jgi:erythromycin esterase-like protein
MWRNTDMLDFVGWLRAYNNALPNDTARVGFYGLDLYSLYTSIEAVISYLERVDPESAERARRYYSCFERFGDDPQTLWIRYGFGYCQIM